MKRELINGWLDAIKTVSVVINNPNAAVAANNEKFKTFFSLIKIYIIPIYNNVS